MRRCFAQRPARYSWNGKSFASSPRPWSSSRSLQPRTYTHAFIHYGTDTQHRALHFGGRLRQSDTFGDQWTPLQDRNQQLSIDTEDLAQNPTEKPEHWVAELDRFLPQRLSANTASGLHNSSVGALGAEDIIRILTRAHEEQGLDVLLHMALEQKRYKVVVYLAELLLNHISLTTDQPFEDGLPSNIQWPEDVFGLHYDASIELERNLSVARRTGGGLLGPTSNTSISTDCDAATKIVWSLLADLVTHAATNASAESQRIMSTVHQILASVHNLGLVPNNIYADIQLLGTATIRRPPMLHMLNSRILSTLSDAVWNAHQDDVSAQATKEGKNMWSFLRPPPGTRLRSRLRELSPNIWVELILWCCIEFGMPTIAARVIKSLHKSSDEWHAVLWSDLGGLISQSGAADPAPQQTMRTFLEPASGAMEAPSSKNVISAEVVLATAEGLINDRNAQQFEDVASIEQLQDDLRDTLIVLVPQTLSLPYLDYLATHMLQTVMANHHPAGFLRGWSAMLADLQSMHNVNASFEQDSQLTFDNIVSRTELQAGIAHQALQALIETNLVKKSVDLFTDLQRFVDSRKLQAIGEFLSFDMHPEDGFFTPRNGSGSREFLKSFGQLPFYKVIPVLDMATHGGLFGLGDWLLFSDDIDGPMLPSFTWSRPSIAQAVLRYAAASRNPLLVESVHQACRRDRFIAVNTNRAFALYFISAHSWAQLSRILKDLNEAPEGGFSPKIFAKLAGAILHLESSMDQNAEELQHSLEYAVFILRAVLEGAYDGRAGVYRVDQKKRFRLQVGYMLRLLENLPDSKLVDLAAKYKSRFPVSNEPFLATETFNILFSAITSTKGVFEARNIWYLFCKDPRYNAPSVEGEDDDEDWLPVGVSNAAEQEDFNSSTKPIDVSAVNPGLQEGSARQKADVAQMSMDGEVSMTSTSSWAQSSVVAAPAYPPSLNIEVFSQRDAGSLEGVPLSRQGLIDRGIDSDSNFDVPFEEPGVDLDDEPPVLNPVVVPNMRSLQILIAGASQEITTRLERGQKSQDLQALLVWAEQYHSAFDLADDDIQSEFRQTSWKMSLPYVSFGRDGPPPRRVSREKKRLNLSSQFASGAFTTRLPGPASSDAEKAAAAIFGADADARPAPKDGATDQGPLRPRKRERIPGPPSPDFHIRRRMHTLAR
jgi:hypothetical protein